MGSDRQTDRLPENNRHTDRILCIIRQTDSLLSDKRIGQIETLIIKLSNSRGPDRQTDLRRITDRQTGFCILSDRQTVFYQTNELVRLQP